jgi:hypothetical protein
LNRTHRSGGASVNRTCLQVQFTHACSADVPHHSLTRFLSVRTRAVGCAIRDSVGTSFDVRSREVIERPATSEDALRDFRQRVVKFRQGGSTACLGMPKRQCFEGFAFAFCLALFLPSDTSEHYKCSEPLSSRSCFRWQVGRTSPCCAAPGVASTPPRASAITSIRPQRPVWPVTNAAAARWWRSLQSSEKTCDVASHLRTRIRRFQSRVVRSTS